MDNLIILDLSSETIYSDIAKTGCWFCVKFVGFFYSWFRGIDINKETSLLTNTKSD